MEVGPERTGEERRHSQEQEIECDSVPIAIEPLGEGAEGGIGVESHTGDQRRQRENDIPLQETQEQTVKRKKKRTEDIIVCGHCGNDAPEGKQLCAACDEIHKKTLEEAKLAFLEKHIYPNLLCTAIHVQYLNGNKTVGGNQRKRALKLQELLRLVSALRNTESGYILIHVVGLSERDNFTGEFDQFVDKELELLINDDRQFTEVYKTERLSSYPGLQKYHNFLLLTVEKSDYLLTTDTKTKEATDVGILEFKDKKLRRFLRKKKQFETTHHQPDVEKLKNGSLQESREIQHKAIFQNDNTADGDEWLYSHLIKDLKLPHYVSAFSKNRNGGSYIAGVKEKKHEITNEIENVTYLTTQLLHKPATVMDIDSFPSRIQLDLRKNCLVCDYDGNIITEKDLVKVEILDFEQDESKPEKYIIVISVRPVRGIVFYDKQGPVAYVVAKEEQGCTIECLPFKSWFEKMTDQQ